MAELVDALDSGSSARKGVEVQILFRAPFLPIYYCILIISENFISHSLNKVLLYRSLIIIVITLGSTHEQSRIFLFSIGWS